MVLWPGTGNKNIDIVYGPEDEIPVIIMNLDELKTVDLLILIKTMEGETVAQKEYDDVQLEGKNQQKVS